MAIQRPDGELFKKAPSHRMRQLDGLVTEEVSAIITKTVDLPRDALITITSSQVSPDVGHAKVFVSVLPYRRANEILKQLNANIYEIQQHLNKRLHLKKVPKIRFVIDEGAEHAAHVDELLSAESE